MGRLARPARGRGGQTGRPQEPRCRSRISLSRISRSLISLSLISLLHQSLLHLFVACLFASLLRCSMVVGAFAHNRTQRAPPLLPWWAPPWPQVPRRVFGCLHLPTSPQTLHNTTPRHASLHLSLSHLSLISLISLSHIAVAFLSCISHSRISRSRISRSHISLSCISLSLISLSYLSLWYLFVFVISVSHLSLMACRMARVLAVDGAVARAVCSLWARRPQQDPLNSFSFSRCGLYLSTILLPGQINTISLLLWPCYRFHIGITPNS